MPQNKTIGFIPQDNRPVSFRQPVMAARLAGCKILTPPSGLLGYRTKPGDCDKISEWFIESFPKADGWVVSLDMLAYGGLVASRELLESLSNSMRRIDTISEAKKCFPAIPVYAFQAIRRLSITVKSSADLRNWKKHHENDLLKKYRSRNHKVNLRAIKYLQTGALDRLSLLQEDARPDGPQLKEQKALLAFAAASKTRSKLCLTTGADEGALVLLTRLINRLEGKKIKVKVIFSSEKGADRIALYEDRPVRETVFGQLNAIGAEIAVNSTKPDFELYVWCPDRPCVDLVFQDRVSGNPLELTRFVNWIRKSVQNGRSVVVADLAYANGADPEFCRMLSKTVALPRLAGYSAWNTAANAAGYAVAQGALNLKDKHFLALRLMEDWGYQAEIRAAADLYVKAVLKGDVWSLTPRKKIQAEKYIKAGLCRWVKKNLSRFNINSFSAALPWARTFEMDIWNIS
ncbi:MAG: hypothetical protein A2270_00490 [Elusimicrobia bacterium RIFOXYA12_FULL_51_18]|nr:MAG: hypothetical protein A2270_00490 [Elusimicrobia bacterium RIFOXYA12_FULL_51_18]OGS28976.1 MAG: hypothetical protein A2218_08505 [Elusimicrobia bacterium RIFOXYA2_FULL_53_38]